MNSHFRNGTQCFSLILWTSSLPFLTELHSLFYVSGIKCIPAEIVYELLTPIALAHWIQNDGTWQTSGLGLCTHSFTIVDVVLLINVLIVRYGVDCTLQMQNNQPRIYIRARSIPLLRSVVMPYMTESMLYKPAITLELLLPGYSFGAPGLGV